MDENPDIPGRKGRSWGKGTEGSEAAERKLAGHGNLYPKKPA